MGAPTPPPGWYPDPANAGTRRYWDGQAWHDAVPARPGAPTPSKPPRKVSTKALIIAAAAFVALVVIGNVIESRKEARDAERSAGSSPSVSAPAALVPAVAVPAVCVQPPAGVQQSIDASFSGGERLEDVFAVAGPGGLVYVGGNIVAVDGSKVSSADVWLVSDGAVFSLSGDARRHTPWPDGRDIASAGDEYGTQVQDCVTGAERARNAGR